ncbi:Nucleotidyltransferase/DNA polymerase-like protein involved in DNA repair [Kribbella flavida DSM 17836]|uniref:Nucleotidyltransferase/DNA polymerase-like protein involved in DNA repair n=1 Tax=Kribbella flavida (strain DSM 17836 / JCM 10339 / NBRC 14399) TaxID=479435 RepID=D2Q395_KRIFD|nr:DNA polymerase Y family protein [Kribbella flavida]ADB32220.1 Nucleotidyltransferase/DNA polymerase-like protein involved in DNA repair [Kribbella flavida DSM 17836]
MATSTSTRPTPGAQQERGLQRTMVIWVPDWPVLAAASAEGVPPETPLAVLQKGRVLATSAAARAEGVRRGLRAREAQSRCPELVVLKYDPVVDARAFDPVISCLEALTPGIQVIRPGMCALKARGPSRYYGSEPAAAEKLLDRLETYDVPGSRVGIADGPFAAEQAARAASAQTRVRVVPPGGSAEFLAPLSIDTLERPALTDLLRRLGLRSLGAFARLPAAEVLARFGPDGAFAHQLARGDDDRPVVVRQIPPELTRTLDFEPPVDRVDQVAFAIRTVADELIGRLSALGLVCTTLRVEVGTESGRIHEREWLHPRWFSATDVVDRVRWQLQGSGTATSELTSPVVRLRLIPEQADPVGAHADALWGGGPDERIHRALSRVQSMLGHGAVVTPVISGGRGYAERQTLVPWGDPPTPHRPPDLPWPGSLPAGPNAGWPVPVPTTIYPSPLAALVLAADGRQVSVSARGVLSGAPAAFRLLPAPQVADSNKLYPVTAWTGPWPVEERWWDEDVGNRLARFQLVTADGRAWLAAIQNTQWWIEASYD